MDAPIITYTASYSASGGITGVMPTPIESIEEFRVGITNQTADFGNSSGAQVVMVTKRGTNQFHGSVYEFYFGNNVGAANDWVSNHTIINGAANPIPISHRNRFGWSLCG